MASAAPGRLYWAHCATAGNLQSLANAARDVARRGAWGAADKTEADEAQTEKLFRAWLVDVLASVAALGPTPMAEIVEGDPKLAPIASALGIGQRYLIELRPADRTDDFDWQNAIVVSIAALASQRGARSVGQIALADGVQSRVLTRDADPPSVVSGPVASLPAEVSVVPAVIGAVVVISCVGLVAGAVGWITSQYFEAKAIGMTADAKAKQTAQAIQAAVDVVEKHQSIQIAQNKTLPYDQGELAVLDSLRASIKELSGWEPPALKSAPNLSAATSAIGAGLSVGTAIILLVVAWLLFQKGGGRAAA